MKAKIRLIFIENSLRKFLTIFLTAFVLIPFFGLMIYVITDMGNEINQNYITTNINSMPFIVKYIDGYHNDLKNLIRLVYNDKQSMEYLRYETSSIDKRDNLDAIIRNIFYVRNEFRIIRLYTVFDQQLLTLTKGDFDTYKFIPEGEINRYIPFYQEVGADTRSYLSYSYMSDITNGTPIFTMNQAIYDIISDRVLAVVSLDINFDYITKQFEKTRFSSYEQFYILNANRELMYHYGSQDNIPQLLDYVNATELPFESGYMIFDIESQKHLLMYYRDTDSGLLLLKTIPNSILNKITRSSYLKNVFVCIIMSLLIIVVVNLIAYNTSKSLKKIVDHMKEIENGRYDIHIDGKSNIQEFEILSGSFNMMADKINRMFNEQYRMELAQRSAELKALQAQINPHFLYNTLQNIQYMALKRDAYEINAIVVALRDIMKYALRQHSTVTLKEEYEYAEKYLLIMKFRYLDDLEIDLNMQEDLSDIKVPKMFLQPLIENCFIHGFTQGIPPYILRLQCYTVDQQLAVEISDNGTGLEHDRLAQIQKSLRATDATNFNEKHIGLLNVYGRLNLLCKGNCVMVIESEPNVITTVRITIPLVEGI